VLDPEVSVLDRGPPSPGCPMHGLLDREVDEILRLFGEGRG
jgi:hypothetical protein